MRSYLCLLSTFFIGAIAAFAGCGSGDCGTYAESYCAKLTGCQPYIAALYATTTTVTCLQLSRDNCERVRVAPGSTFTADQAGRCGAMVQSLSCDDLFTGNLPADCRSVGTRNVNEPCGDSAQCQTSLCKRTAGYCGTCQQPAQAGQACGGTSGTSCVAGLSCTNSVCVAYASAGQTCSSAVPCLPTLRCASGTCGPRFEVGAACPAGDECKSYLNQFCDPATKTCAAITFSYVNGGDMCGGAVVNNTVIDCKADFACRTTGTGTAKTCTARTPVGQACGATTQAPCVFSATCLNGTCQVTDPGLCG